VPTRKPAAEPEKGDNMKKYSTGPAATLALVLFASVGCGEADPMEDVGTVTSAITIGTMDDLKGMGTTGSYTLTTNLNATGTVWTPKSFSGTFDGGNFTISNLTIDVSNTFNAGFFTTLLNATVKRVRFVNLRVTGQSPVSFIGGLAGQASDSLIQEVGVEVTVTGNGASTAGGIVGQMFGGTIDRCYTKGSVNSATLYAGGLVGGMSNSSLSQASINRAYSTATVAPTNTGSTVYAGGIVGYASATDIREIYATGNVTGRGAAGGILGYMDCDGTYSFTLNHGIYRGNVTDLNISGLAGGWGGVIGGADTSCVSRFDQLWWNLSNDGSTNWYISPHVDPNFPVQRRADSSQLRTPTTPSSGIYQYSDNNLTTANWDAGTYQQHHALKGLPGGLSIQPR
jgi:hypothetical protein